MPASVDAAPIDRSAVMLRWAVVFLIIALIAAMFGFTDIAAASAGIAKVLFAIFLLGFLLIVLFGFLLGSRVSRP
jgi:uncharacterized membrane protein YtjA (UPF0391 family)